jgi:outer membrane protein assembly factor BamB
LLLPVLLRFRKRQKLLTANRKTRKTFWGNELSGVLLRMKLIDTVLFFCFILTSGMLWGNGSLEWNASAGGVIFSSPAIASDGTVYVGSNDNKLHAFNSNGTNKWTFTTGNWVDSTPAIGPDGTVYVGSWDNKLYAINPTDGTKLWDFNTSSNVTASPAIGSDGRIYFGSKDYFFYALNSSGTKLWEYFAGQAVSSSAALGQDGTIYFGDENGTFHAVNPDGSAKWSYVVDVVADTNKSILSSPALDLAGNIYFGSGNGYCYSIADNDTNASLNWKVLTGDRVDASPVLGSSNEVFFVSRDGYIRSIDTITGISNWENLIGDVFYSSPAVDSNGKVYVVAYIGGGENHLFAFESNGSKAWDTNGTNPPFTIGGVVDSSLALDANGKLYFGCYDNNLYAVNVGTGVADSDWPQFQRNAIRTGAWPSLNVTTASFPIAGGSLSGSGQYNEGAMVSLQATPATGYSFTNWTSGGVSLGTANPYEFNASADLSVTANFTLQSYAFTISAGTGGTVPTGLSQSYSYGTVLQISATPNTGYQFASWTGSGIGNLNSKDTNITIGGVQTATANFAPLNYILTVTASSGGSVSNVTGSYPYDTNVSLVATPNSGYAFASWVQSGNGLSDTTSASVTARIDNNQSIHATFSPLPYNLSLTAGAGGSATNEPAGTSHNFGSQVTITAIPDAGYYFTGWTGSGITDLNASTTTATISGDQSIQASFAQIPAGSFLLQLTSNPGNSAASLSGSGAYNDNQVVQISAVPAAGYTFQNWTGGTVADENSSSTSVAITQDLNLTANFLGVSYQLIATSGTGGTTNGSGSFAYGASAQISATPETGYTFVKWDGNLTFANQFSATTSVNVTQDANVTASFAVSVHSVTLNSSGQGFATGAGSYSYDTQVSLTATPLTGHSFVGWSGTGIADSNESTISVTVTQDLNITATFRQLPSPLNESIGAQESVASWYTSNWLGYFYQADNGWCYHFKLGWIYPNAQADGSIWAWSPQLEWIWIEQSSYANSFIWSSDDGNWLFFDFEYSTGPRIYTYLTEEWSNFDRDGSIDPLDSVF